VCARGWQKGSGDEVKEIEKYVVRGFAVDTVSHYTVIPLITSKRGVSNARNDLMRENLTNTPARTEN
jgi:hypothetical protein